MTNQINDQLKGYEEAKKSIYLKNSRKKTKPELDDFDVDLPDYGADRVGVSDVIQVGSKVVIGGGLGLLAGVATIAVVASAAEVIIAGAITKVAGVVGGAVGLSLGLNSARKKKKKSLAYQD